MLLSSVNLSTFPPPGSHVAGMSLVMFEGLLTNIDRRIQLYVPTCLRLITHTTFELQHRWMLKIFSVNSRVWTQRVLGY